MSVTEKALSAVADAIVRIAEEVQAPAEALILANAASEITEAEKMASAGEVVKPGAEPSDHGWLGKRK